MWLGPVGRRAETFKPAKGRIRGAVIPDCDVHQGNGTASLFREDPSVFTFSIHGKNNFPYQKETSDLDIALEDGIEESEYLRALEAGLREVFRFQGADLAIYLAGADPFREDRFGRLRLSKKGLERRDDMVFDFCRRAGPYFHRSMLNGLKSISGFSPVTI